MSLCHLLFSKTIIDRYIIVSNRGLLADAEVGENVGEGLLGGDFAAGDGGEVVEAVAEIFGHEVGG